MHSKYIELFKELAKVTAFNAEQVMDYNQSKNDDQGYEAARKIRNDFDMLHNKMISESFDGTLTKSDFAYLLVGCHIIVANLNDKINNMKKSLTGYQTDIIPKLNDILQAENDEQAMKLAEEKFQIKEETNN